MWLVLNAFIPPNAPTSVTRNEDRETPDEDDDEE